MKVSELKDRLAGYDDDLRVTIIGKGTQNYETLDEVVPVDRGMRKEVAESRGVYPKDKEIYILVS